MSVKTRWLAGVLSWYESDTDETLMATAPVWHKEDFLGGALNGDLWTALDTNGATETMAADQPGGVLELALTSANEIQLAGVSANNQRNWTLNRDLVFEARVRFTVLPTGSVVACIGLAGDHNAAVNSVAESIWFRLDGSGTITVETDDTSNETSQVATGVTLSVNEWATLRIECDDPADVRFYINGARVASGTTFDMSTVPALQLQRVARIGKESAATTVGTMQVDYLAAWQDRA